MGERLALLLFPMALGSAILYLILGLIMAGLILTRDASRWSRAAGTIGLIGAVVGLGWALVQMSDTFGALLAFAPVLLAIPVSVGGSVVALALLVGWFVTAGHQTWETRRGTVKRAALIGFLIGATLGAIAEVWFLQRLSPSLRQFG